MSGFRVDPAGPEQLQRTRAQEPAGAPQPGMLQQNGQQNGTPQQGQLQQNGQQNGTPQPGQLQQNGQQLTPVQQPEQQEPLSALEKALRGMEKLTTLSVSKIDVEKLEGAREEEQFKGEKRSLLFQWAKGFFKRIKLARLSKAARKKTRSDVQRLNVKQRLQAIAKEYAANREVKKNRSFQDILKKVEQYGKLDVTAEKETTVEAERRLYDQICKDLAGYIENGLAGASDTLLGMATRLHVFFMVQQQGNLEVPANVKVIKDNLRPATVIKERKVGNSDDAVYVEDESQRDQVEEKDMSDQPLFSHEPSINDIRQGYLGDCFFLAALGSIVDRHPQTIKDCMRDNGKTVTVRFYQQDDQGAFVPIYVNADKKVPVWKNAEGKPDIFASGALWVQMMERAYALVRNTLRKKDRFGNEMTEQKNQRKERHEELKRKWEDAQNNPDDKQKQDTWRRALSSARTRKWNAFMFDDNGQFILDYDSIPTDPSYADIASGYASEVFQAVLGRKAETQYPDPDSWMVKYGMERFRQLHGPADGSASNKEILKELLVDKLRATGAFEGTDVNVDKKYLESIFNFDSEVYGELVGKITLAARMIRAEQHKGNEPDVEAILRQEIDDSFGRYAEAFPTLQKEAVSDTQAVKGYIMGLLKDIVLEMMEGAKDECPKDGFGDGYSKVETEYYDYIKDSLAAGKVVSAATQKIHNPNAAGLNHESMDAGFVGSHAYTVLGVTERETTVPGGATRTCKYVKLRNPWGKGVVRYKMERGQVSSEEEETGKGKQGFFLVELHDFLNRYERVYVA